MSDVYWIEESEKLRQYESIYKSKKEIGRRMYQPTGCASFTLHCQDQIQLEWVVKTLQKPVRLREVFETDSYLFMVSEYVDGLPLLKHLECVDILNEQVMSTAIKQILDGILYLHNLGIAHRNIKPCNILVTRGENPIVRITDSAFSTVIGMDMEMELVNGDITFTAPEIFLSHKHGKPVDLWAIGVLLFIMASGLEPFKRANEKDTFRAILTADFHFEELPEGRKAGWGDRSVHLHDLVRRLLVTDTVLRMTAEQARRHAWVTGALGVVPTTMLPLLPLQLKRYNQLLEQKAEYWGKVKSMRAESHLEKDLAKERCGVALHGKESNKNRRLNEILY